MDTSYATSCNSSSIFVLKKSVDAFLTLLQNCEKGLLISSCPSVCLSVCLYVCLSIRMEHLGSLLKDFHEI
jgi:hypothetical protein